MVTEYDKALAALVVGILSYFLLHLGVNIDTTTAAALTTILTSVVVYFVPNKQA